MSLLPGFLLLIVLTLLAILSSLFSGSAFASLGPPKPQPCKNAIFAEERLTDNWLVDENKDPPQGLSFTIARTGLPGAKVNVSEIKPFIVDFSKLQAIFGIANANYLEGRFQDETHRQAALINLDSVDFNNYHGAGQKAAPKVMVDQLRVKYVEYLYNKPELAESANTYTDIAGQGEPKTVYGLVNEFGLPVPPEPGQDRSQWLLTWGRYWGKIPTAYSEFYEGRIIFRAIPGREEIQRVKNGELCPNQLPREITFIMPEFFRTTAVSGQLNQVLVPKAAQSEQSNNLILAKAGEVKNLLGKIIDKCLQAVSPTSLSKSLQKVIKITFNFINPIRTVYAQGATGCLKFIHQGKAGEDPYCALPAGQLQLELGESCDDANVVCNFRIFWAHPNNPLTIGVTGPGAFDECHDFDDDPDTPLMICTLEVAIWPIFRIPWISEIWNNTLYSDAAEPSVGTASDQETGRPGIYSIFSPKAIFEKIFNQGVSKEEFDELRAQCIQNPGGSNQEPANSSACNQLFDLYDELAANRPSFSCDPGPGVIDLIRCFGPLYSQIGKSLPGEVAKGNVQGALDASKERFIGATDCSKEFVRDVALKPKALQEALGIKVGCKISGQ